MIKIKTIRQTCIACPTQYEGWTDDERPVYIRYRWGHLSIRVGEKDTDHNTPLSGEVVYSQQIGNKYDGFIELDDIKSLTVKHIIWRV